MLKRYRLLFIAIGGIAFVAIVMALALLFQPQYLGEAEAPGAETQAKADDQSASNYRSVTCYQDCQVHFGAEQSPESEGGQEPAGKSKSESQRTEKSREGLDLLAQRRMAYWSIWIAGFTLTGLAALFWTLYETRRMTQITATIGREQNKAYVPLGEVTLVRIDPNGTPPLLSFNVNNTGNTPAEDFKVGATLTLTVRATGESQIFPLRCLKTTGRATDIQPKGNNGWLARANDSVRPEILRAIINDLLSSPSSSDVLAEVEICYSFITLQSEENRRCNLEGFSRRDVDTRMHQKGDYGQDHLAPPRLGLGALAT